MNNYKENEVDDVATHNQQLVESPKVPAQFTIDVYKSFSDYLELKYGEYEIINHNRQKELDYVLSIGTENAKEKLKFERYPILFEGKKPRIDVLENLGKIACAFSADPKYPEIKSMTVTTTINKIMVLKVKRTREKYLKCVKQYLGRVKEFGIVDVSDFVNRIPKQYLETSSTSSFGEKDE